MTAPVRSYQKLKQLKLLPLTNANQSSIRRMSTIPSPAKSDFTPNPTSQTSTLTLSISATTMSPQPLLSSSLISLRTLAPEDFSAIANFEYSVSITEPHSDPRRLAEIFAETGMWLDESGAVAIIENATSRLLGTLQFYRSAPCIHGLEIGYVVHSPDDRGKGYAAQSLRLLSNYLFAEKPQVFRIQLLIEVWNTPSWKVAERCGFIREGILRSCGFGDGDPADCFAYSRTRKDHSQDLASSNGPA